MIFGKIEYLNLLPFHVFMKRYSQSTQHHMSLNYKKGVPSKINREFAARRIDAAFISSIGAKKCTYAPLGIVAKKEVLSVLLIEGDTVVKDSESATSNILADILDIKGEVLIGDKALRYYLAGNNAIDLAEVWHKKYQLPFVFALLCHHGHTHTVRKLSREFLKQRIKIPYYILKRASQKTGVKPVDIMFYLTFISYHVDEKAERGLHKFWKLSSR